MSNDCSRLKRAITASVVCVMFGNAEETTPFASAPRDSSHVNPLFGLNTVCPAQLEPRGSERSRPRGFVLRWAERRG